MKKFLLIIIIVFLVILTAPCNKLNENSAAAREVIFWTLQMNDFSDYMNGVISEFEVQNPDIKIKWIDVPFSEGEKRTLASVLSDNPPDLINLNPDFSATLAQKGTLYEIPADAVKDFNSEIINSLKYNGKLYSIPWYATSAVTIFNKALAVKSGIQIPKTYEELAISAPVVRKKKKSYIFITNKTENGTMHKNQKKYGVNSYENINSEKSAEVFELFKDLYQKNLIPKESITQTHREALEKYMSENILLFQAGANFLNMIKENAPKTYENTDVAPQLTGEIGQNDFSLMNFVIPLRAKNKDEALKFAVFLTNEKNQLELAKLTNVIATNQKALQDDFYTKYEEKDLMAKARVISAKQLNHIEPALQSARNQKDINNLINSAVQEILLNKASTKEVLDKVSKDWKLLTD